MMDTGKMSKRSFLKTAAFGAVGCSLCNLDLMARTMKKLPAAYPVSLGDLDKWTIEAKYYIETPKGLKCLLCPTACKLKKDEEGECRTRINLDGKLFCFAYGNPCAVHVDPIEKKPLYHFYPGTRAFSIATAGCNLACLNCQNWEISQTSPKKTRNYDLMPDKVVEQAIKNNCQSIAYTYSDPVVFFEYTLETSKLARDSGLKNVIVSAGYINDEPLKEWCKYIDAANIDLKSFNNEIYEMLNAGTLEPVLNTLKTLRDEGIWLEITNLVVPDWTDDPDMIKQMCNWLVENGFENYPIHFSRFHPQYKLNTLPATPLNILEKARNAAISEGMNFVYIGNVTDTNASNTYCPDCKDLIIQRKGYQIDASKISQGKCKSCGNSISGRW